MLRGSNIAFSGETVFELFDNKFECEQNCEMLHVPIFKSVIKRKFVVTNFKKAEKPKSLWYRKLSEQDTSLMWAGIDSEY